MLPNQELKLQLPGPGCSGDRPAVMSVRRVWLRRNCGLLQNLDYTPAPTLQNPGPGDQSHPRARVKRGPPALAKVGLEAALWCERLLQLRLQTPGPTDAYSLRQIQAGQTRYLRMKLLPCVGLTSQVPGPGLPLGCSSSKPLQSSLLRAKLGPFFLEWCEPGTTQNSRFSASCLRGGESAFLSGWLTSLAIVLLINEDNPSAWPIEGRLMLLLDEQYALKVARQQTASPSRVRREGVELGRPAAHCAQAAQTAQDQTAGLAAVRPGGV